MLGKLPCEPIRISVILLQKKITMEQPEITIYNIADTNNKIDLMRKSIQLLLPNKDLGFVVAHMISTFIDGLAKAPKHDAGATYKQYLKDNFPELCRFIDPDLFYENLRNKAIHEFAPLPPLAIARASSFGNSAMYAETRKIEGKEWICLNVDILTEDFLRHLDIIETDNEI